ncbi:MAG: inosine/xanthosine triphosphatase [Candidatus Helarchaeota archaeon]
MKVLVGSLNPVKIQAVRDAFSNFFNEIELLGIEVDSKVPKQPKNDQTFEGARNRALELYKLNQTQKLNADYFVGIEGGIIELHSKWFTFGVICILDDKRRIGWGTSPFFELPKKIIDALLKGIELGVIMDQLLGTSNIKQKEGAIGFFTRNVMNRKTLLSSGVITALIPFLNENLYFE